MRPLLNFTQKLDSFGEALFFYPVANNFSQTNCQIPSATFLIHNLLMSHSGTPSHTWTNKYQ